MRKILMLASMLAFALFVASPALAQDEEVGVCHYPPGNPENGQFIGPDESSYDAHVAHGDKVATQEECEGTDDVDGEDVDGTDEVDVDGTDDGTDDGDDTVIDNENNNTNVNVNNNVNNTTVVVNLANFNQNVNTILVGGTKVEDFNKDGVITVFECKQAGVSKSAAVTFAKTVVEKKVLVEDNTVVTGDTTVVTGDTDVVTGDTTVVTGDTTTTTGVLPETGGASLLALGVGALLVAGGLLARRIVR